MKKILIILFIPLAFLFQNSHAQSILERSADNDFNRFYYKQAIENYLALIKKDTTSLNIQEKLALCYRKINDSKSAELWLAKVVKAWKIQPEYKLYYAQSLAENKKYKESKKWYSEYYKDMALDPRGKTFANAYGNLNNFYADSDRYHIKTVPFNSGQLDFSPVLYQNGIVFVSNRTSSSSVVKNTFDWDYSKYLDLYFVANGSDKAVKLKGEINSKYHEGPVAFTKYQDTVVFTRNNYYNSRLGQDTAGTHKLKLYMAVNKNGKWTNIVPLPFNSDNYSVGHPCFSPDFKKLYFVSDAPGGYGGTDLYLTDFNHGEWGTPKNLGKTINTKGNEMFPYVDSLNTLYYSSDGLPGLGGLDLFYSKLVDTTFQKPVNMGAPMNSSKDDFGIVFSKYNTSGYFTSSRKPEGDDDIYSFFITKPVKRIFKVLVEDSASSALIASTIILSDSTINEKQNLSDNGGTYQVNVFPNNPLSINAEAQDYNPQNNVRFIPGVDPDPFIIKLAKNNNFLGFVYEKAGEHPPIDSAVVVITKDKGDKVCDNLLTESSGKYLACKLNPGPKYTATASKNGYFTNFVTFDTLPADGRLKNIYLDKIVIGKAIIIDKIYFDFDQSYIRPDAAIQLDKIVKLLQDNPEIIIELGSHTDCRGSAEYNMALSDRRAKSSAAYIISKGIDSRRISGKGYGESELLTPCPCEGNVYSSCTEEQHQLNRRTEFKVTGYVNGMGKVNMNTNNSVKPVSKETNDITPVNTNSQGDKTSIITSTAPSKAVNNNSQADKTSMDHSSGQSMTDNSNSRNDKMSTASASIPPTSIHNNSQGDQTGTVASTVSSVSMNSNSQTDKENSTTSSVSPATLSSNTQSDKASNVTSTVSSNTAITNSQADKAGTGTSAVTSTPVNVNAQSDKTSNVTSTVSSNTAIPNSQADKASTATSAVTSTPVNVNTQSDKTSNVTSTVSSNAANTNSQADKAGTATSAVISKPVIVNAQSNKTSNLTTTVSSNTVNTNSQADKASVATTAVTSAPVNVNAQSDKTSNVTTTISSNTVNTNSQADKASMVTTVVTSTPVNVNTQSDKTSAVVSASAGTNAKLKDNVTPSNNLVVSKVIDATVKQQTVSNSLNGTSQTIAENNVDTKTTIPVSTNSSMKYYIIQGYYRTTEEANLEVNKLKALGYSPEITGLNQLGCYRVSYYSFNNKDEALKELERMRNQVQKDVWLLVK